MSVQFNCTFIGQRDFDLHDDQDESQKFDLIEDGDLLASELAEIIVARVLFALLVSVSLVLNLLLAFVVACRWKTVHFITG